VMRKFMSGQRSEDEVKNAMKALQHARYLFVSRLR
jgi:hypothetical protein